MIMTFNLALFNLIKINLVNFKLIGREIGASTTISTKFGELRPEMLSTIYDSCDLYLWIFLSYVLFRRLRKGCLIFILLLCANKLKYPFELLLVNKLITLLLFYKIYSFLWYFFFYIFFLITCFPDWTFYSFRNLLYLYIFLWNLPFLNGPR